MQMSSTLVKLLCHHQIHFLLTCRNFRVYLVILTAKTHRWYDVLCDYILMSSLFTSDTDLVNCCVSLEIEGIRQAHPVWMSGVHGCWPSSLEQTRPSVMMHSDAY